MLVVRTKRDNRQRVAFFKARRTGRRKTGIKKKKNGTRRTKNRRGMEMKKIERREEERCEIRKIAAPSEINV